jgi:AraC family transcriptional regulator of adaptative response/methylated-DNA-[protein]-cysteine methyltransferase
MLSPKVLVIERREKQKSPLAGFEELIGCEAGIDRAGGDSSHGISGYPMIRRFRLLRELKQCYPALFVTAGRFRKFRRKNRVVRSGSTGYHHGNSEEAMSVTEHHLAATADQKRWESVLERDHSEDGEFVYAVTSTRIYCRPSCPSRRPARHRVLFFLTAARAEAAGYRACRRCEPESSERSSDRQIQLAREYLDAHVDRTVTLAQLGEVVGMSPYHLQRIFKRVMGVTPKAYASARRLERMKSRLKKGDTVSRATYEAGYGSGSRAYEHARGGMGMTPGAYRNGGLGAQIRYTIVKTKVGHLLAAATERGLCAVMLGDGPEPLESSLYREFPAAVLERDDDNLREFTQNVVEGLLDRSGNQPGLPLDVAASTFQWQVWDALRRIPVGETRSYQAIARELGRPAAARAVARACASNRLALVIPCHRVVREDGDLGGYRWGMDRKRRLL